MQRLYLWLIFIISPLLHETSLAKYILAFELVLIIAADLLFPRHIGTQKLSRVWIVFSLYFLWSVWIFFNKGIDTDGVLRLAQIVGCIGTFYLGASIKWDINELKSVKNVTSILLIVSLVFWVVADRSFSGFRFIYTNPNTFASFLFTWLLLLCAVRPYNPIHIIICLMLLYFTGSRSALLCGGLFIVLLFAFDKYDITKRSKLVFLFFCIILLGFVLIYPTLMTYGFGQQIDRLSRDYFDKGLETGRHYIWREMFETISTSLWTGFGLSATPLLADETRSCHNTFIQQTLQSGVIGLGLLIAILYCIFSMNKHIPDKHLKNALMCVVLIIMAHESFEVCLTQNCFAVGLMSWMLMGILCNVHLFEDDNRFTTRFDSVRIMPGNSE